MSLSLSIIDNKPKIENNNNLKLEISYKPQQSDFDNVSFIPDGFLEDFVETFLDVIWDVDGDKDFDGLVIVLYNFIPGIGANGDELIQPIFYIILISGMWLFAKRWDLY